MILDAIFTNTISNALHAIFLFIYFIASSWQYKKKNTRFSLLIVLFFLNLFVLKMLGIYAHYYNATQSLSPAWIAISLMLIMLNYLIVEAMQMPNLSRISVVFLSIISSFLFLTHQGNFFFVALPIVLVYLLAAYYSQSMLRYGFLLVVFSNILWISLRGLEIYVSGHTIPLSYRYDNDIYHILLIISTYVIYKAITKGYWPHSNR